MRTIAFLATIGFAATAQAVPSQYLYEATPYILRDQVTGDLYRISGTFTTSCNECSTDDGLAPTDIITDFRIEVSGPMELVFSDTEGADLVVREDIHFTVTPASIQLPNEDDRLIVDQSTDTQQIGVAWFKGLFAGPRPDSIVVQSSGIAGFTTVDFSPSPAALIVATAVPEPSGVVLSGLVVVGLLFSRRQCS